MNKDCSQNQNPHFCNDSSFVAWCAENAAACPSPYCTRGPPTQPLPTKAPTPAWATQAPMPCATCNRPSRYPSKGAVVCVDTSNNNTIMNDSNCADKTPIPAVPQVMCSRAPSTCPPQPPQIYAVWAGVTYLQSAKPFTPAEVFPKHFTGLTPNQKINTLIAFAITPSFIIGGTVQDTKKNWPILFSKQKAFSTYPNRWLCIGGGGYSWNGKVDLSIKSLNKYIAFCREHNYNGIQLDIEASPPTTEQIQTALRHFKCAGLITSITPSYKPGNQGGDLTTIWMNLDWTNCDYIFTQLYANDGAWDGEVDASDYAQAWYSRSTVGSAKWCGNGDGIQNCKNTSNWGNICLSDNKCTNMSGSSDKKCTNITIMSNPEWKDKIVQGVPLTNLPKMNWTQFTQKVPSKKGYCFWAVDGDWTGCVGKATLGQGCPKFSSA